MTATDDDRTIKPFAKFLRELQKGRVHEELSTQLHDLVAAVQDTGKAGTLTLTLKVEKQKNTDMLLIGDDVKTKIPKLDRASSLWFVDGDGNVSRDNPDQLKFDGINVVPDHAKEA
ncbi:hypothetical protein CH304_00380 [Rhodococcus sp. 15-649-1-2]|nr:MULTISPECIES: hypothetical protein [unclassified Rhodococcus (in: high G+C Gram-positive bacteria)]OZC62329.1 hypothetical protein CH267_01990 [Rhodococcus sp. 06-621-2]OZE88061.1 hypothetical protein CH304_00380 [Rhodococcus sp. 15-649-1-2]